MKPDSIPAESLIPPALLAEVEAMAAAEHRPVSDVVREAIEGYLHDHNSLAASSQDDERLERLLLNGLESKRIPLDAIFRAQFAEKTAKILDKHKDRARP